MISMRNYKNMCLKLGAKGLHNSTDIKYYLCSLDKGTRKMARVKSRKSDSARRLDALNAMLRKINQNKDFLDLLSQTNVLVEKEIAERASSSYVSEEKLQAAITL